MSLLDRFAFRRTKSPLESKGVVGGAVATASFGILAWILSRVGVPVSADELEQIRDQGQTLLVNVDAFRETIWPAMVAAAGGALALAGNITRQVTVGWSGGYEAGKGWSESKGVAGGAVGLLAAAYGAIDAAGSALVASGPEAAALAAQGKLIIIQAQDWAAMTLPTVAGLAGLVVSIYGRVAAAAKIAVGKRDGSPGDPRTDSEG